MKHQLMVHAYPHHTEKETSILGYTKMHTGTDTAPKGTPIMASGDSKVTRQVGVVVVVCKN